MRAMTGVRINQPSSLSVHSSCLRMFITSFPLRMLHNLCHTLPSCPSLTLSCPSSLSLSSSLLSLSPFHLILPSFHSSLSGITLVDETPPVDEPSDSDQVTEGVKFAYTLPHQQSNQDSQDDTALVCVHPCACVSVCVCTCIF